MASETKIKGWIGCDFDGTLATYDGYKGAAVCGEPIIKMVDRVKRWLAASKEVRIFTARVYVPPSPNGLVGPEEIDSEWVKRSMKAQQARAAITDWCKIHIGTALPITCIKDSSMYELWDDRAVQLIPNTGFRIDGADTVSLDQGFQPVRNAIIGRHFFRHEVDLLKQILENSVVPDPEGEKPCQ